MKKVLITGGTGFLGSSLTRNLVKRGYKVSVFDNDYRGKVNRLKDIQGEYEFIKGDVRNASSVERAVKGKDSIFHLAYINGTEFFYSLPELVLEVGVKGMMNVLDASLKWKISEIFLASSSEVYNQPEAIPTPENVPLIIPDPRNPRFSYSGGKIISELLLQSYGKKYFKRAIIFRPHNVYGPDMGFEHVIPQLTMRMLKNKKKPDNKFDFSIQGNGNESRSFIFVDDFILGLEKIIKKGKHLEIYNIGTENEIKIKQLTYKIANLVGCSITLRPGKVLPGSTTRRLADISKIKKLGFKPKVSLDDGLEKTVSWYMKYGQNK